jgi:hypothetical protein
MEQCKRFMISGFLIVSHINHNEHKEGMNIEHRSIPMKKIGTG